MISYGLSRRFPLWLSLAFIVIGALSLSAITVVQYGVAGYETVTKPLSNYSYVDNHWYNRFGWGREANRCDRAILLNGMAVSTSTHVFDWQITYARYAPDPVKNISDVIDGSMLYGDDPLNCAINDIWFSSNVALYNVELNANVVCQNNTAGIWWYMTTVVNVNEQTTQNTSGYAGAVFANDSSSKFGRYAPGQAADLRYAVDFLAQDFLEVERLEYGNITWSAKYEPDGGPQFPISIQGVVVPQPCSHENCSAGSLPPQELSSSYGVPGLMTSFAAYSNASDDTDYALSALVSTSELERIPFWSMVWGFISAVNIDLGIAAKDNVFLNEDNLRNYILPLATIEGEDADERAGVGDTVNLTGAWDILNNPDDFPTLPLNTQSLAPVTLVVLYNCKVTNPKTAGAAFFSVFAATVATFSSVWGALIFVGAFVIARHDPAANHCSAHGHEEAGHKSKGYVHEKSTTPTTPGRESWSPHTPHGHPPDESPLLHHSRVASPHPYGLQSPGPGPGQRWSEPAYHRAGRPPLQRNEVSDSWPSFTPKS